MPRATMIWLAGAVALAACGERDDATTPSGQRLFSQCAVCHTSAPADTPAGKIKLVGPPLFGVYGRAAAAIPDFQYSKSMREASLVWDDATLDQFLAKPQAIVPGTNMSYVGEADPAKRAAIIDYLKTLKPE
jgi:cytochrome c